ncbi:hypothetical protein Zmor_017641 [Zophobas morio]|uniref:Uncharacterized protein n=1 Tax=Zophobas morio TaxID=2755281 RepID=A0AA38ICX3_9CUCU|nr:hypothetical protein Zmor_017641 [Zophobas morio]
MYSQITLSWTESKPHITYILRRNSGGTGLSGIKPITCGGGVLGCQALGRLVPLISKTRLADLGLCSDLYAPGGGTFSRQLPLQGRKPRGCSQSGDTDLRW